MAIQFDGQGYITYPDWTSGTGVWSIRLPSVKLTSQATTILAATDDDTSNFVAFVNDRIRFRVAGTNHEHSLALTDGDIYDIEVGYDGANRYIEIDGNKQTFSTSAANMTFDTFGRYGGSGDFVYDGLMSGTVTFTGGTENRTYDTDNSTGTVLTDTTSSQNGTLTNFDTGGFVASEGITISTSSHRIWQRNSSDQASVTITGSYVGSPTTIERSLDGTTWVTAVASPSGNSWSDTFTLATGQYTLRYRFSNEVSKTASITPIGVGDIYAVAGQSNASGRGLSNQTFTDNAGGATAFLFGNDDEYKQLADPYDSGTDQVDNVSKDNNAAGSWIVRLANEWLNDNNIPIGFIPCARGGTTISAWSRSTSTLTLYGSMLRRINAVGGVRAVLWELGETDSNNGTTLAAYQSAMIQLAADINSDFGVQTWIVPLHTITASGYAGQADIRQAQINAAAASANIEIGSSLTDIDISDGDGLHFQNDDELQTVARRVYLSLVADTSDLTITLSGIPDGTYRTVLVNDANDIIYSSNLAYSSSTATVSDILTPAGTNIEGYVIDNETPHVNGAVIVGTTE